jgi:hypothetical protein
MIAIVYLFSVMFGVSFALKPDKVIVRPDTFPTLPGQSRFNLATYDTSILSLVSPAPLSTLVEVLRLHSDPLLETFKKSHTSAMQGKRAMFGDPYEKRAQKEYDLMLQDYMPMNEADAAAARYLLNQSDCAIRVSDKMPTGMTACQYHGTKILADIVRRLVPIHSLLTEGFVDRIPDIKKVVHITNPPELDAQIKRIANLLGDEATAENLMKIEPTLSFTWNDIRRRSKEQ